MATPYERRRGRKLFLTIVLPAFALAVALALVAVSRTQVYAYAPSTLPPPMELGSREVRLAGLVAIDSLNTQAGDAVTFRVTDGVAEVPVRFDGILPALVAENEGVIAQGRLGMDGIFTADNVLARHDENYEAPEVVKALREAEEASSE
jgi:cytochrome c-type biogenesis protein CcmE